MTSTGYQVLLCKLLRPQGFMNAGLYFSVHILNLQLLCISFPLFRKSDPDQYLHNSVPNNLKKEYFYKYIFFK